MQYGKFDGVRGDAFQSAPGLEAGRCIVRDVDCAIHLPVSIRARPRGRAMHGAEVDPESIPDVSIRARPRGRAMLITLEGDMKPLGFQSAPGLEAGRCDGVHTAG